MSRCSTFVVVLSVEDRERLAAVLRKRTAPLREVQRARIVLAAADGVENLRIADEVGVVVNTVSLWRKPFHEQGMAGLVDRARSGRPRTDSPSGRR